MTPYALVDEHPHGVVRAVAIPEGDPPPEVMARLTAEERALCREHVGARLATWVAGRLALASALEAVGAGRASLLSTSRGAPAVPPGFVGSVSHKKRLAVALAARDEGARLGVDVEEAARPRVDVSPRVLTDAERAAVGALPDEARWRAVIARFSLKESIYKALDPFVKRYVGFKEAEIDLDDPPLVRLSLERGEGPFAVEATWTTVGGFFLTTARIRPAHEAQT